MRLIGFGPGEMYDRLTILELKIQYAKMAGKSPLHFINEMGELWRQLPYPVNTAVQQHVMELAAVNAINWAQTDEVRVLRDNPSNPEATERLAELCIRLQEMNDRRAELIAFINGYCGHTAPEEKV